MNMKLKRNLLIFAIALLPSLGICQEILTGIATNAVIAKESKKNTSADKSASYVKLPFFDDFSGYTGYPSKKLWNDRQAFVNTGFAIYPPTVGVVTLDILDEQGKVYSHANSTGFPADTLTSALIRLDSNFQYNRPMSAGDSLYLSFYYQPAGGSKTYPPNAWSRVGDAPEHHDKLVLEFGYSTGNIVFSGFIYGEYVVEPGQYYTIGDSIENPFIPGTYYVFENDAFPGQVIMIPGDSIFAEEYVWNQVWSTPGVSTDDWLAENPLQYFKHVMIPITDEQYFRKNFQFRFRNYGSLDLDSWTGSSIAGWSSNCDQWNIDYVKINTNRTLSDIHPNDVAFVTPTTTALKEYYAMPWQQYRVDDMSDNFHNDLSNLSATVKNTHYSYTIVKNNQETIYTFPLNNENAMPYYTDGLHNYASHTDPPIAVAYSYDGADSALFTITHVFGVVGVNDDCRTNDTCVFEQKFYNYYAYDDGVAEAGYSLLSTMTNPDASLAVKFKLAQPDTLQAVRMWFNRTLNDENVTSFDLVVWDDNNGMPGEILYEKTSQLPAFANDHLDYVSYYLEEPLAIEGTFYVGFHQNSDIQLNIGFDQNNDARGKIFYKTSSQWNESFYMGAPMIRPVVGKSFDHSSIAQHHREKSVSIYPNPAQDRIFINTEKNISHYELYNSVGKLVKSDVLNDNILSVAECPSGIFFLKLYSNGTYFTTEKIIKR